MSGPMDPERLNRMKLLAERAARDSREDWGDPEVWRGLADTSDHDFDVAAYLAASRPEVLLLLLADLSAHAREGERAWAHAKAVARAADGHKSEAERLRGERDRLKDALDRAADLVPDLTRRGRSCSDLADGYMASVDGEEYAARCVGKKDAYVHAAELLASALRIEADAPEGEH